MLASAADGALPPSPARSPVTFTHVTVIDGTGAAPNADQTVVVADGRIMAIAPAGAVAAPPGARVIDGTGKYLIPGLWDMHVHVLWEPAIDTLLPLMIANGVTGARDMHTHVPLDQVKRWIGEVESGRRVGPRMVRRSLRRRAASLLARLDRGEGRRRGSAGRTRPEAAGRVLHQGVRAPAA
jgi:predicted amidohydrolase YtcJ